MCARAYLRGQFQCACVCVCVCCLACRPTFGQYPEFGPPSTFGHGPKDGPKPDIIDIGPGEYRPEDCVTSLRKPSPSKVPHTVNRCGLCCAGSSSVTRLVRGSALSGGVCDGLVLQFGGVSHEIKPPLFSPPGPDFCPPSTVAQASAIKVLSSFIIHVLEAALLALMSGCLVVWVVSFPRPGGCQRLTTASQARRCLKCACACTASVVLCSVSFV